MKVLSKNINYIAYFITENDDPSFVEKLRIELVNNVFYYVAEVPGNSEPTRFEVTVLRQNYLKCENPTHDFPKEIIYERDGERLTAIIADGQKRMSFAFRKPVPEGAEDEGIILKCFRCAIWHRPMVSRSLMVALVIGTILTVLNQGDIIFTGSWKGALYWKVPITYCVPFCVATYGALSSARR